MSSHGPCPAPDLPAVVASGQHEAVLPVVEVQALFCEGLIPLPTKDTQTTMKQKDGGEGQALATVTIQA